ncbi:hypothetical protein EGW08_017240, partial [Elysia chlorotica]
KEAAQRALDKCIEFGLIKENAEGKNPVHFLDILRAQLRKAREEEERKRKLEEEEEERRKKEEEEEKKKREEEFEKNQIRDSAEAEDDDDDEEEVEEVVVEQAEEARSGGPKIQELTEEEVARLELEERLKPPARDGGVGSKVVRVEDVEAGGPTHLTTTSASNNSGGNSTSNIVSNDGAGGNDEDDLDETELDRGDVWNDEAGLS